MYKKIDVTTKEMLEMLKEKSLFTWEGMSDEEENLKAIEKAVRENGFNKEEMVFYVWSGKLMNESYDLKGNNAYPDDLTFVGIEDFYNPSFKLQFRARWLDDIVDNIVIRNN